MSSWLLTTFTRFCNYGCIISLKQQSTSVADNDDDDIGLTDNEMDKTNAIESMDIKLKKRQQQQQH